MPSIDDSTDGSDAETDDSTYVTTFDPGAERASSAVISAVAALSDEDPNGLAPLYEVVDPDALDSLVQHAQRVDDAGSHELWFGYEGFDVGVRTDGEVRIHEPTPTANSSA